MTIGNRIRLIRTQKNMTQKEVAERCGMADSAIRKYESGLVSPKLITMQKIANALQVEIVELLPQDVIDALKVSPDKLLFVGDDGNFYAQSRDAILPLEFNDFEQFIESQGYYIRLEDDHYRLHKGTQSVAITATELQNLVKSSEATVGALVQSLMEQKENPPQD